MKNLKSQKGLLLAALVLGMSVPVFAQSNSQLPNTDQAVISNDVDDPREEPPGVPPPRQVGLSETDADINVNFYPNPCTDQLIVETTDDQASGDLNIYSLTGNKVLTQIINQTGVVNVSHLKPGIYILNYKDKSYRIQKL